MTRVSPWALLAACLGLVFGGCARDRNPLSVAEPGDVGTTGVDAPFESGGDQAVVACADLDHDGFVGTGDGCDPLDLAFDCDDHAAEVHPDQDESKCDGRDDNCDGQVDENCFDGDPPVVGVDDTDSDWRAHDAPLTLSVRDAQSAIDFALFRWDDGDPVPFVDGDLTSIPSDGVHSLSLEAGDVEGNVMERPLTLTYRQCSQGGHCVEGDACVEAEAGFASSAEDLTCYQCPSNHFSRPGASVCRLWCPSDLGVYRASGHEEQWQVPMGCDLVLFKVWGAGGEGDSAGPGGFSSAAIEVTPGELLSVRVGGRSGAFGGGAGSRGSQCNGGRGGDYSGVFRGQTPLIMAGGGGGHACSAPRPSGGGGGEHGGAYDAIPGGSQTGPGLGVYGEDGHGHNGGAADYGTTGATLGGGGGGGGLWGGGGGHTGDEWGTGGSGGSGFVPPGGTSLLSDDLTAPMSLDPDYADEAAAPDHDGRIVILRAP